MYVAVNNVHVLVDVSLVQDGTETGQQAYKTQKQELPIINFLFVTVAKFAGSSSLKWKKIFSANINFFYVNSNVILTKVKS